MIKKIFLLLILVLSLTSFCVQGEDINGSKDHPLISRFPDSSIIYYKVKNYDEYTLPLGALDDERNFTQSQEIKGKITRIQYKIPKGISTLEVFENYKKALKEAEFKILFERSGERLGRGDIWTGKVYPDTEEFWRLWGERKSQRFLSAKISRPKNDIYLTIYISKGWYNYPLLQLDIIEVQALETDKISIDVNSLTNELKATGFIRIYGIYFDIDKATMKSKSKHTLEVIANTLKKNPDIKIYVVGHTDNKGSLEYNMVLAKKRAISVVKELEDNYDIKPGRLHPEGVGPLSPIASNNTKEGREKNRRVELVIAN